ncbi:glycosyltransferase family 39 protein [Actinopolymorpha pittospori]
MTVSDPNTKPLVTAPTDGTGRSGRGQPSPERERGARVPGPVRRVQDAVRTLPQQRRVALLLDCLLAASVAVVLLLYRIPPFPSDQLNYFDAARDFPAAPTYAGMHQFLRIGLTLPLRLAQEVFGYSQVAYLIVPMLAGFALVMCVYALGTMLFHRAVGVAAATLTLANTLVFPDLTVPLPDLMATALLTAALVLALALRQRRRFVSATTRRQILALLAVGALLGWSYLTREYIVFCWPLVGLLLLRRVPLRRMLWILAPLAVVGIGESVLNALIWHDPLARVHASAEHGSGGAPPVTDYLNRSPRWYLTRILVVLGTTPEGIWLKLALAGTVLGAFFSRRLAFLLVWAALFYVPIVTLGGLLNPEAPSLRILKERYWLPLVPALTLAAIGGVWLLVRHRARELSFLRRRATVLAGVAAVLAAAVPSGVAQYARSTDLVDPINATYAANGGTQLEEFRSWLSTHADGVHTIWADRRTIRPLALFVQGPAGGDFWQGRLHTWSKTSGAPASGDHIVVYSAYSLVCGQCRRQAEAVLGRPVTPPSSWRRVFTSRDRVVEVYQVR